MTDFQAAAVDQVRRLFNPRSVALIGATDKSRWSWSIFGNLALARRRGLTILGPNGNGFINAAARITPYGLPIDAPLIGGPVGVVLQSGALASAVLTFAQTTPALWSATTPWSTRSSASTA